MKSNKRRVALDRVFAKLKEDGEGDFVDYYTTYFIYNRLDSFRFKKRAIKTHLINFNKTVTEKIINHWHLSRFGGSKAI